MAESLVSASGQITEITFSLVKAAGVYWVQEAAYCSLTGNMCAFIACWRLCKAVGVCNPAVPHLVSLFVVAVVLYR